MRCIYISLATVAVLPAQHQHTTTTQNHLLHQPDLKSISPKHFDTITTLVKAKQANIPNIPNSFTTINIMQIKKYIPDFLLPTDEPAAPPRIYDIPLRRERFHKSKPGNEYTVSASRNNSVVSERRGSSAVAERRTSWHPGMIFGH